MPVECLLLNITLRDLPRKCEKMRKNADCIPPPPPFSAVTTTVMCLCFIDIVGLGCRLLTLYCNTSHRIPQHQPLVPFSIVCSGGGVQVAATTTMQFVLRVCIGHCSAHCGRSGGGGGCGEVGDDTGGARPTNKPL